MAYNAQLQELIKNVEKTREKRTNQKFPSLDLTVRDTLLKKYHPDYITDQQCGLRVGVNKGDKVSTEVANILESYSIIDSDAVDLNKIRDEVDVLVVGAGGAGLAAALEAHKAGAKTLLVTKLRLGDSNTIMAQGGIQAADKENDSPVRHYLDVMGGGHFTNDPELVKVLTKNAPATVRWLENLGVMFDKQPAGSMITNHGGGTSRKRMHSARDYTGLEILRVVRDEFLNLQIPYREFCSAIELIKDRSGQIAGALLLNVETNKISVCRAKTVILATGGIGRLHVQNFPSSNHYGATGDGLAIGYRAGVPFVFLNAIQYHPTGAVLPKQMLGILVTEKLRGLGAQLVNCDGERFVHELQPRDVVASAIIREVRERKKGILGMGTTEGIWLDSPLIDKIRGQGTIQRELPAMYKQFEKFGIYIDKEPILIYPTQHYQNGGLKINSEGQTTIPNLFAVGEIAGGIHGENRLMGNSLLDIFVFGRRAGKCAAGLSQQIELSQPTLDFATTYNEKLRELGVTDSHKSPILFPTYT